MFVAERERGGSRAVANKRRARFAASQSKLRLAETLPISLSSFYIVLSGVQTVTDRKITIAFSIGTLGLATLRERLSDVVVARRPPRAVNSHPYTYTDRTWVEIKNWSYTATYLPMVDVG